MSEPAASHLGRWARIAWRRPDGAVAPGLVWIDEAGRGCVDTGEALVYDHEARALILVPADDERAVAMRASMAADRGES